MPTKLDHLTSVVETIHGIPVADPYRWLEDRTRPETEDWIAKQHDRLETYFRQLEPLTTLEQRVLDYVDVENVDGVGRVRDRYFYRKRRVREQQSSIFVMDSSTLTEHLLVAPSDHGPYTSVRIHRLSADSNLLAYEVKQGGEHSKAIHVVAVDTGAAFPDHLERGTARGFAFSNRNDGFYYCHDFIDISDRQERDHVVCFHRFGTAADDDLILLALPRSQSSRLVFRSHGEILSAAFCHEHEGDPVLDYYVARQNSNHTWQHICHNVRMPFIPFFYRQRLFAHHFQEAPNGEIVELDLASGVPLHVIVPEWDVPINHYIHVQDRLYIAYLVGADTVVRIWSLNGDYLGTLPLEVDRTWRLLPAYTEDANEFFLHCESFNEPPTLFRYDPHRDQPVTWNRRHSPASTAPATSSSLTYSSKDGTEIMMSLVGRHDSVAIPKDRPIIMTAYGGFGLTLTPQFSVFVSIMLELGCLFALPKIRGGGERGKPWHEAARGRNRQAAFDDFIAGAQWLCDNRFTSPQRLAIFGGSNSGLLVGAAITQRPDLFRAALCVAPLLDMIRYHLFDQANNWAAEYGTADNPQDFQALLAYSPYHHISEHTDYPAALFVAGDQDTRCNPAHARKMVAALTERPAQSHPILLDHSVKRGHAPTMPLSVRVDALTSRIAFLCRELGIPIPKEAQDGMVGR